MDFRLTQEQNTTAVYVDGVYMRQATGCNTVEIEESLLSGLIDENTYLSERVIFGWGRVALVLRTRTPRGWDAV